MNRGDAVGAAKLYRVLHVCSESHGFQRTPLHAADRGKEKIAIRRHEKLIYNIRRIRPLTF